MENDEIADRIEGEAGNLPEVILDFPHSLSLKHSFKKTHIHNLYTLLINSVRRNSLQFLRVASGIGGFSCDGDTALC